MRIHESSIRPIPRQSIHGFMSLGIIEDDGKYYVLQMEPQQGIESPPFVRVVNFQLMKRSSDILNGDTSEIILHEEREALLKYAVGCELLTEKRVEIAVRKAAATSLSARPPQFHHRYKCLMYMEKFASWDMAGRKGTAPSEMISTYDCWRCPKNFRDPCIQKLVTEYEEEIDEDRYVADIESSPS
jgi:hypothetical protein